jgi:hypothetical protein
VAELCGFYILCFFRRRTRPSKTHITNSDPAAASGGAKLLKLAVESLPYGADAGIAHKAFLKVSFDHNLGQI